jgi:hypothetical protein
MQQSLVDRRCVFAALNSEIGPVATIFLLKLGILGQEGVAERRHESKETY